jgi:hypothetical protein
LKQVADRSIVERTMPERAGDHRTLPGLSRMQPGCSRT